VPDRWSRCIVCAKGAIDRKKEPGEGGSGAKQVEKHRLWTLLSVAGDKNPYQGGLIKYVAGGLSTRLAVAKKKGGGAFGKKKAWADRCRPVIRRELTTRWRLSKHGGKTPRFLNGWLGAVGGWGGAVGLDGLIRGITSGVHHTFLRAGKQKGVHSLIMGVARKAPVSAFKNLISNCRAREPVVLGQFL